MKILLIEDNPGDARLVGEMLKETTGDFAIDVAEKLGAGLEFLASHDVDLVLADLGLPDSRGLETLAKLRTHSLHLPIVIMTSINDEALGVEAVRLGAQDYLVKGHLTGELLRRALMYAVQRKKAEEDLRQSQQQNAFLANVIQVSSQPFGVGYPDGRLGLVNAAFERLTGYTGDELRTIDWSTTLTPPEWRDVEKRKLEEMHRTGLPVRYEKEYIRKDGSRVPIELLVQLVTDEEGKPQYYYSFLTDITERKQAEETMRRTHEELGSANVLLRDSRRATLNMMEDALAARKRAEEANTELKREITERKKAEADVMKLSEDMAARNLELEAANKEMEAFIYSVSHDLRAPLRTMSGFSRILIEDYGNKLENQPKDYMMRITHASEKMTELIEDLLRLSRISKQDMDRMDYDLSRLASSISTGLREADPGRSVDVAVAEGLRASVDPNLIRVAFANLIENAWKFTSKTTNARIEFNAFEKDGKTVYYVKDNGAGFDMTYANKMFLPFQRLHTDKEFEGTGIGLAIVERIIRRHNGAVWAEGEVGKGATVFFTLGA